MNVRLSGHDRKLMSETIQADIDAFCKDVYTEDEERKHLGASVIGQTCNRRIAMSFRHMHREDFDGRKLRLFNRGHETEPRFVSWLRGADIQTWDVDQNGKQFRISDHKGHFGGSLDGIVVLPPKFKTNVPLLLEIKTHNDKSFQKLIKYKVQQSKPQHYVQMSVYGYYREFDYALYVAINKNDDSIYVEVVAIDHSLGKASSEKAKAIIFAVKLPPRIAASPAFQECSYCPMRSLCHEGAKPDVNCRSCINSIPIENGQWACKRWNAIIPPDAIKAACPEWCAFQ